MKKIGILGGLGPEATIEYYRGIIEALENRCQSTIVSNIVSTAVCNKK